MTLMRRIDPESAHKMRQLLAATDTRLAELRTAARALIEEHWADDVVRHSASFQALRALVADKPKTIPEERKRNADD